MTALAADRITPFRANRQFSFPVKGSTKIYAGSLVCLNSSGLAVPGSTSTTLKCVGVAIEQADNSSGADSAINVTVERGLWRFGNSASGDAIALTEVGSTCYVVDDQTLAKTNGSSSRSAAGTVRDVDSSGVWVDI